MRRWIHDARRRRLVAGLAAVLLLVVALLQPRQERSTLVLAVAADGSGSGLAGLGLGSLGPLPGGLSLPGGDGLMQLRRVQLLVAAEESFHALLRAPLGLGEELGLDGASAAADSADAYRRYRRELVSTSLDKQAQTLEVHVLGPTPALARGLADSLGRLVVHQLAEMRHERSAERREGVLALRADAQRRLAALEDSLVALLEGSRLAMGSPRVQQRIQGLERDILLWSQVRQAMSAEEIRLDSSARSDIPDVFPITGPTRYDQRSGVSRPRAVGMALVAGLALLLMLGVLSRVVGREPA